MLFTSSIPEDQFVSVCVSACVCVSLRVSDDVPSGCKLAGGVKAMLHAETEL